MKADIQSHVSESVILAFEAAAMADQRLARAAFVRVADAYEGGIPAIVVCPEPIAMATALARAGVRTVTIPSENLDQALLIDLVSSHVIPVLEGEANQAVALAQRLRARVIIYTTGKMMSGDPRFVTDARCVERVSHLELLELSETRDAPVPLRVVSGAHALGVQYEIRDLADNQGTIVRPDLHEDASQPITSISVSTGFSFVSIRPKEDQPVEVWPAKRAECLERLASRGVSVEMLQFMPERMRFVVAHSVAASVQAITTECDLGLRVVPNCSKLIVVGAGIRTTAGVFHRTLTGLADRQIPVLHFSDSNVTMSLLVLDENAADAQSLLHEVLTGGRGSLNSPISFDAALGKVRVRGEERRLGSRQAKLLEFLIDNVGRVVEAEEAARHLFGSDGKDDVAALRVHLHNLRKKIEDDPDNPRYIVTVPAQGYLFVR